MLNAAVFSKVAVNLSKSGARITQTAARAALREAGLAIGQNAPALLGEVERMRKIRRQRAAAAALPARPSISERLVAFRTARMKERREKVWNRMNLNHGAPGGCTWSVEFVEDPASVGYVVTTEKVWGVYKGAYKNYPALADHHTIRVAKDWIETVENAGIGTVGGISTLDARLVDDIDGTKLYEAVWAVQGRGYEVNVKRGFIAIRHENQKRFSQHAKTRAAALAGVKRRLAAAA